MFQMGSVGPMLGRLIISCDLRRKRYYAIARYDARSQTDLRRARISSAGAQLAPPATTTASLTIACFPWIARHEWQHIDRRLPILGQTLVPCLSARPAVQKAWRCQHERKFLPGRNRVMARLPEADLVRPHLPLFVHGPALRHGAGNEHFLPHLRDQG